VLQAASVAPASREEKLHPAPCGSPVQGSATAPGMAPTACWP
jgi:hypothetical protein